MLDNVDGLGLRLRDGFGLRHLDDLLGLRFRLDDLGLGLRLFLHDRRGWRWRPLKDQLREALRNLFYFGRIALRRRQKRQHQREYEHRD